MAARIRTIKPEFFTSEDIVELSPLARIFFIALWCEADREGRLAWKLKTLRMRYLPGDECEIEALAQELTDSELIVVYEIEGKKYAEIPSFKTHQVINNREKASKIPSRHQNEPTRDDASLTRESGVKAEGKGREGKGKEVNPPTPLEWGEFKKSYPDRGGMEKDLSQAQQMFNDLVEAGEDPKAILQGVRGYASACERVRQKSRVLKATSFLKKRIWTEYQGAEDLNNPTTRSDAQAALGVDGEKWQALLDAFPDQGISRAWLAPLIFHGVEDGTVFLEAENSFIQSRIRADYSHTIKLLMDVSEVDIQVRQQERKA